MDVADSSVGEGIVVGLPSTVASGVISTGVGGTAVGITVGILRFEVTLGVRVGEEEPASQKYIQYSQPPANKTKKPTMMIKTNTRPDLAFGWGGINSSSGTWIAIIVTLS